MSQVEAAVQPVDSARPLKGKVAIVTGAAKGFGVTITEALAAQGAHIALVSRDVRALEEHAAKLDARFDHRSSLVVPGDVLDESAMYDMAKKVAGHFGGIDILINNAGGTGPIETAVQEIDLTEFRQILDLNVVGTFLPSKAAIPYMIERRNGRIVNISGTSGLRGYPYRAGYSASKWAVRGFTKTLALELGQYGITVNTVCPNVAHGARMDKIITERARKRGLTYEQVYEDFASQTALGRFIDEVDTAAAVAFLVSDGARNITGHDLVVDAGWGA